MTCQLFCQALMKSSAPAYAFFTWCCLGWIVYFEHKFSTVNIRAAEKTCRKWDWTIQLPSQKAVTYTHIHFINTHTYRRYICILCESFLWKSHLWNASPHSGFDIMLIIRPIHRSQRRICSKIALLRWIWQFPGLFWQRSCIWHMILTYTPWQESKCVTVNPSSMCD